MLAGKTTLLNVLGGRLSGESVQGEVREMDRFDTVCMMQNESRVPALAANLSHHSCNEFSSSKSSSCYLIALQIRVNGCLVEAAQLKAVCGYVMQVCTLCQLCLGLVLESARMRSLT